jgi:hypothetical protein
MPIGVQSVSHHCPPASHWSLRGRCSGSVVSVSVQVMPIWSRRETMWLLQKKSLWRYKLKRRHLFYSLFPQPNVTVVTYVNIYNITPPWCSRDAGGCRAERDAGYSIRFGKKECSNVCCLQSDERPDDFEPLTHCKNDYECRVNVIMIFGFNNVTLLSIIDKFILYILCQNNILITKFNL